MSALYVSVSLSIPVYKEFTYSIPSDGTGPVFPGTIVEVDFHSTIHLGCVSGYAPAEDKSYDIRPLRSVLPLPPLRPWQLQLADRVAWETFATIGEARDLFIPSYRPSWVPWDGQKVTFLENNPDNRCPMQNFLREAGIEHSEEGINLFLFREICHLRKKDLTRLVQAGSLQVNRERWEKPAERTEKQEAQIFWGEIRSFSQSIPMIRELLEPVIRKREKALIVLPGISAVDRFSDLVSPLFPGIRFLRYDGRLSSKERYFRYRLVEGGHYDVLVGTRLALFLPAENVDLHLLFDPEELGHFSDRNPRYDSLHVLFSRVQITGGRMIILGVTPNLWINEKIQRGIIHELSMKSVLPRQTKKMEQVTYEQKKSSLTLVAQKAIGDNLARHGRTIIWTQKTGYSSALGCADCGYYYTCPQCDVALRYHRSERILTCPRCGMTRVPDDTCPRCHGAWMRAWGEGVERVFQSVRRIFPGVLVKSMEADDVLSRENVWTDHCMILVGTSAVLKEEILEKASLLVVNSFEEWLMIPDFRLREHLYQDLHTAWSYLGEKSEIPSRFIVQCRESYQQYLGDFFKPPAAWYGAELKKRQTLHYPPFTILLQLIGKGRNSEVRKNVLMSIRERLTSQDIPVEGPFPGTGLRKKGVFSDELMVRFSPLHEERVYTILTGIIESRIRDGVSLAFEVQQ